MTTDNCKHGAFNLEDGCPHCIAERDAEKYLAPGGIIPGPDPEPFIVKVRYYSETTGESSAREYTYYSEDPLEVGDIVKVPMRDTTTKAKVSAVNVPESEIAAFKDKVRTIPAGAKMEPRAELPTAAEVGETLEGVVKAIQGALPTCEEMAERLKPAAEVKIDTKVNLCDTCNNRQEYPVCSPTDVKYGDGLGNDNIIKCPNYKPETAIALRPGEDLEVRSYYKDALGLLGFANDRVIATAEDNKGATDDLSLISKLKKQMEAKKREYLDPLKEQADAIRDTYNYLMAPVLEAERTTKGKMLAYDAEQNRIRAEQEEINRKRLEAAQQEMKLKGELSEPVNLVEVDPATSGLVHTDMGTAGPRDNWKYEIIDPELLPRWCMVPDATMLNATAKKHHDKKQIPGVRFYNDPIITVRAK